jgi:hypothetical protein
MQYSSIKALSAQNYLSYECKAGKHGRGWEVNLQLLLKKNLDIRNDT